MQFLRRIEYLSRPDQFANQNITLHSRRTVSINSNSFRNVVLKLHSRVSYMHMPYSIDVF